MLGHYLTAPIGSMDVAAIPLVVSLSREVDPADWLCQVLLLVEADRDEAVAAVKMGVRVPLANVNA